MKRWGHELFKKLVFIDVLKLIEEVVVGPWRRGWWRRGSGFLNKFTLLFLLFGRGLVIGSPMAPPTRTRPIRKPKVTKMPCFTIIVLERHSVSFFRDDM